MRKLRKQETWIGNKSGGLGECGKGRVAGQKEW